jgi:protein-S-isoprenylcysteine O-methyltransferase Ste14
MPLTYRDYAYVLVQFMLFGLYLLDPSWLEVDLAGGVRYLGLALGVAGVLITALALLQLNKSLSPFPSPKSEATLIQSGLYRYVRHPIYSGIILMTVGYSIYANSGYKLIIALLLWVLFYLKSTYEEKRLLQTYSGYKDYQGRTGRFWPRFWR